MSDVLPVSPLSVDPPARPSRRKPSSQKRRRRHRGIGHYDDREHVAYLVAYERYRNSGAADDYGSSESAFNRWSTIGAGARKLPPRRVNPDLPPELVSMLARLMTELQYQGNNLNQIAHHQNAGRDVSPDYVRAAHEENAAAVRAIRLALAQAFGWED